MPAGLGRLRSAEEFERVKREGGYWRGRLCALNAARRAITQDDWQTNPPKVGYITPRRLGKAVHRNRARRLLRESVRLLAGRLPPHWDIVLIAQRELVKPGVRMRDVQDELIWLLTKAHILMPAQTQDHNQI